MVSSLKTDKTQTKHKNLHLSAPGGDFFRKTHIYFAPGRER
jgi:hypothetical protein